MSGGRAAPPELSFFSCTINCTTGREILVRLPRPKKPCDEIAVVSPLLLFGVPLRDLSEGSSLRALIDFLFPRDPNTQDGEIDWERLEELRTAVGNDR